MDDELNAQVSTFAAGANYDNIGISKVFSPDRRVPAITVSVMKRMNGKWCFCADQSWVYLQGEKRTIGEKEDCDTPVVSSVGRLVAYDADGKSPGACTGGYHCKLAVILCRFFGRLMLETTC